MRVALELQPCCGSRSGIGNYTYELAKRLRPDGILSFEGNIFNFAGRNNNTDALAGIEMPIVINRLMPYGIYRRVWKIIPLNYEKFFVPAALTHFFNYIVPPCIQGKVVTTIYDMAYLRFPETLSRNNLRRIESDIAHSIERSDAVVTISEFSKQEILSLMGVPEDMIYVVYPAASLASDIADFKALAGRLGITSPYLLFVGTIEPRKNLARLIRAFRMLKREAGISHQLVLTGGNGWSNEEIHKEAASMREGEVIFTGYVSDSEKNVLYQNAAALVYPSIYEGFGMPVVEAMSFGLPIVCSNSASLPEVVGNQALLVDPYDETELAQGIFRVLSEPELALHFKQGSKECAARFSWDSSAERLIKLYQELLEKR